MPEESERVRKLNQYWIMDDDLFILDNLYVMTIRELADGLGKSIPYVHDRLRALQTDKPRLKSSEVSQYVKCKNVLCNTLVLRDDNSSGYCSDECYMPSSIIYPTASEIKEAYHKEGLSASDIADRFSISHRSLINLCQVYNIKSGDQSLTAKKSSKTVSVSRSGRREDLGVFVRSSWEANTLRYLNLVNKKWDYEPKTFIFDEIQRGTRSYTPDVKIYHKNGSYFWLEVKGYMRPQDKTKIKRFKKYYPDEFKKLRFLTKNGNVAATREFEKLGVKKWQYYDDLKRKSSNKIALWE